MTDAAPDVVTVLNPGQTKSWNQLEAGSVRILNRTHQACPFEYRQGDAAWTNDIAQPGVTTYLPKLHDRRLTLKNTGAVALDVFAPGQLVDEG